MRKFAVLALAMLVSFGAPALVSAQDEEEAEEGGEIDDLMTGDPERPAKEAEEEEGEDEEKPPADSDEEGVTDDERPPGDEPSAPAEPEPSEVEAEASSDDNPHPFSVGVLVGAGFSLESAGGDPWGLGFGLRGGYNIGVFFVGVRFSYYLGETYTATRFSATGDMRMEEVDANLWDLGAEAGFDIRAGSMVVIRPELGIGFASVTDTASETVGFVAPGIALLLEASPTFFLGLDARYQFVATTLSRGGITALGTVGMRF